MPYNQDGPHKKNPTKKEWAQYHKQKGQADSIRKAATKHSSNPQTRLYGGSNAGGASIGGSAA